VRGGPRRSRSGVEVDSWAPAAAVSYHPEARHLLA
jgi:hypothetical protein